MLRRDRDVLTELPHYTKLLLLAAYCGSHNPADTDTKFFSRKSTGRRRAEPKTGAALSKRRRDYMLAGPRPFNWERLLSIFLGLAAGTDGGPVAPASLAMGDLQSQLATLRSLHLVTLLSSPEEQLGAPKMRCEVSLDAAAAVAASLDLDLGKYLYDPGAA